MKTIYADENQSSQTGTSLELNAGESEARSGLEDVELTKNSLSWIEYFHRDDTSTVSFLRVPPTEKHDRLKRLKAVEAIASVRVAELQASFPPVQPFLTKDAYFTVNGFYWGKRGWRTEAGFDYAPKSKIYLRTLNAAYCDLDCGRSDAVKPERRIPAQEALAEARKMVARGELPPFSAYAYSGRGLYLFWRLHDGGKPLSSWYKVPRYITVNNAIYEKLRHLAADIMARDASRILRLPGSINSKSDTQVSYHVETDRVYTLEELESVFNTRQKTTANAPRLGRSRPPVEKMRGIFALNRYRAEEILLIEKYVGGWSQGARRRRLLIYAQILRSAGNRKEAVSPLVLAMAKRCQPPLDAATARCLVASAFTGKCYKRKVQTLCDTFGVTPEMVETLQLKSFAPSEIRASRKEASRAARLRRKMVVEQIIQTKIASELGITGRELTEECKEHGVQISPRQVNRIAKQMRVVSRQSGRPRKIKPGAATDILHSFICDFQFSSAHFDTVEEYQVNHEGYY